ncbi:phosphoglycerate mutase family protein [Lacimicrobium sp. SS2-24]|uniref:SixA phosphatase family protein n=1 Tax=Lacimicrobium sp. SS2-24 TaxID=2005569 RepID=UPI000B4B1E40|nr:phosphoglycerate mutase family protein [Lacimicrobium sp. SS2-24]
MTRVFTLLALLLIAPLAMADYSLYVLRHAHKQADGTSDPALSEAGQAQAERLATLLHQAGIQRIYSTDYRRTRETVLPLSQQLGVDIRQYDPRRLDVLAMELRQLQKNVVVVGHSNTTPELVKLLGGEAEAMSESDYGDVYQLNVSGDNVLTVRLSL